ncbi:MAG: hypothetical protein ACJAW1_000710 [Glaciecola sp.]|jgi:hypothetical protein
MRINLNVRDILIVLFIGLFGVFLYLNFESYEEEIYLGEGPQANENRFLALQTHLALYKTQVLVADDFNSLFAESSLNPVFPDINDVIIFSESELIISELLAKNVLSWVEQGGHIIVGMTRNSQHGIMADSKYIGSSVFSTNHLLKLLGVSTRVFDRELLKDKTSPNNTYNVPTAIDTEYFGKIDVNVEDSLSIELATSQNIIFSSSVLPEKYADQPTIVQIKRGDGLITLMTDVYVWSNYQINDDDNIFFIHQLVAQNSKLYIFEQRDPKMWSTLITEYSPSFYWILLFVVLLSAWFYAVRFGAIRLINNTVMSYFSQHIRAAGQFYWLNGQKDKLLLEVRNALLEEISSKLAQTHPSEAEILEGLAKISGWPKEKIYMFVFDKNKVNETQFTQIMQGLQQLREMIWKN